jgi:small GTP-binding protein
MKEKSRVIGKVIMCGPANVGKTSLIERFVQDAFVPDPGPTLGCDCRQKAVVVGDTQVQLYLYDTAGQERFAELATSYFRVGDVCLLCFDLKNLASFDNIRWWMGKVRDVNEDCTFVLVGTKRDLVDADFDSAFATQFAEENGMAFFMTSALDGGEQIAFLFHFVAEKCIRQRLQKELTQAKKSQETVTISAFGAARNKANPCQACG